MNNSVLDWLDYAAEKYPEKTAFDDLNRTFSFSEVQTIAKRIASHIILRTEPKQVVAILAGRSAFTPILYLAVVYAGCCYEPIDTNQPLERIQNIIQISQPAMIITDHECYELASALCFHRAVLCADEFINIEINTQALSKIRNNATVDDALYIICTSGSTGIPKCVITSHLSLMNYIEAYLEVLDINNNDIIGNQSPLSYIAAIRDIYIPLRTGASTVIIPKKYFALPKQLFGLLNEKRITAIGWSVSALTMPTNLGVFKYIKPLYLRKVSFSGSVMPCRCLRIWQEALPETLFVNQYGPTETTASCSFYVVNNKVSDEEVLPIGTPYKNYRMFLLSEDNKSVPQGEIGEICVGGVGVTLGYYKDQKRTAVAFVQNPLSPFIRDIIYKTGDLGRIREDGLFEFHGRKDRQVKHLGHRVELDEIEVAVKTIEGIEDCCATYQQEKELLYLFYVGKCNSAYISAKLREKLPGYMIPKKYVQLEEMPRLSNGKTNMQIIIKEYYK